MRRDQAAGRAGRRAKKAGAGRGGAHAVGDHLPPVGGRGTYPELGGEFLERLEPERLTRQPVQRLEKLGHQVTLKPKEDAA